LKPSALKTSNLSYKKGLVVEWRPDHPIPDVEYDRDYAPPANAQVDVALPDQVVPIDADEAADLLADNADHHFDPLAAPAALDQGAHEDGQHFYNNDGEGNADNVDAAFEIHDDDEVDNDDDEDDDEHANDNADDDQPQQNDDEDNNEGHPVRIEEDEEDDDSPNNDSDDNGNDEGARESATDDDDEGAHGTGDQKVRFVLFYFKV
jgi:hypothetical protein